MMYKALVSFTGLISMGKGDVREISDISIANDLLKAKYIEEVKEGKTRKTRSPKSKEVKK